MSPQAVQLSVLLLRDLNKMPLCDTLIMLKQNSRPIDVFPLQWSCARTAQVNCSLCSRGEDSGDLLTSPANPSHTELVRHPRAPVVLKMDCSWCQNAPWTVTVHHWNVRECVFLEDWLTTRKKTGSRLCLQCMGSKKCCPKLCLKKKEIRAPKQSGVNGAAMSKWWSISTSQHILLVVGTT